jgi:hypothetical protein
VEDDGDAREREREREVIEAHEKPAPKAIKGKSSGRTEGRGNKAAERRGSQRERVRGEKAGGRSGRFGSRDERIAGSSSARSTQLAARGPSGNRRHIG